MPSLNLATIQSRIAKRRGNQKAEVATARQMLEIIWHMLNNMEEYRTQNHSLTERKYKRMKDRSHVLIQHTLVMADRIRKDFVWELPQND